MQLLAIVNRLKYDIERLQKEEPNHPLLDWKTYINSIHVEHMGLLNHTLELSVTYKQKPDYEVKRIFYPAFNTSGWLSLDGKTKDPCEEVNNLIQEKLNQLKCLEALKKSLEEK